MNVSSAVVCVYLYSIGGLILLALIMFLLMPFVFISGTAWAVRSTRPPKIAAIVIVYAIGLMPLLVPATIWPLRLAAFISKPWLDRLADRVAGGEELSKPEWAGLYRIVDAKRQPDNGNIALIIDANPSGRSAFVRFAGSLDAFGPMVNLNYNEPLGGKWFYQNED